MFTCPAISVAVWTLVDRPISVFGLRQQLCRGKQMEFSTDSPQAAIIVVDDGPVASDRASC
jgi:hypothetical protein